MEELEEQRRRAQALRKGQTREENHLWYDFLKTYPVQFRRQYQIGPYYVDFYCYRASLVIELDGSKHYEEKGMLADKKRTSFLQKEGLTVLRFSNLDIWENFSGVKEAIDAQVKARLKIEGKGFPSSDPASPGHLPPGEGLERITYGIYHNIA